MLQTDIVLFIPVDLHDDTTILSHSAVSTSNDEEDKSQTISITLWQVGKNAGAPHALTHSAEKRGGKGVAVIHPLPPPRCRSL